MAKRNISVCLRQGFALCRFNGKEKFARWYGVKRIFTLPITDVLSAWTFYMYTGFTQIEKYLNIQDCLEKSLKIKFALKSI